MSHTNSTTNYNLPQFVGTDKPTWLNDVNGAFSAIDTQMKANADSATSASTTATTASNAVGTLADLNTTVKTDTVSAINEVNTNLGVTDGKADSAVASALSAEDKVNAVQDYLDLVSFTTYQHNNQNITKTAVSTSSGGITVARNRLGTLGKIYASISGTHTSGWTNGKIALNVDTGLRPTEEITINCAGIVTSGGSFNIMYTRDVSIVVKTTGYIEINFPTCTAGSDEGKFQLTLYPCLYFMKNFGDVLPPANS